MSENNPSGKSPDAGGEGAKDSVAYESYAKLLGEKKKLQSEHLETKAKLDLYEQEKLEAEGKLKEANDNLKKLLSQSKTEKVELFKKVADKGIKSQFARMAEKLGCHDVDMAFKAVSFEDLEITEDFEFDENKLSSKIQDLTKSKPYLFKKDFQLPQDVIPGGQKVPAKSLSDMTEAEIKQVWKSLK